MIITLEGTNGLNNNAVFLATALSSLSVLTRGRKVLVLQLMNRTDINVENYLIGKQLENITLDESVISMDQGIDALMLHIESGKISSSVFTECTRSMIAQRSNLYDVAASSNRMDFEDEFLDNKLKFKDFFDSAQNSYHLVFILLPTNNTRLCEEVLKYSDMNIVSIHQGPAEPFVSAENNIFACVNFDKDSKYNEKFLAKAYGQKRIYFMPENTGFKDAITDGVALKFMQLNSENQKGDINYFFNKSLNDMLDAILGKASKEEDVPEIEDKEREEEYGYEKDVIEENEVVEKQFKRGMRRVGTVASIRESGDPDIRRVKVKKSVLDARNQVIYEEKIQSEDVKTQDVDDSFDEQFGFLEETVDASAEMIEENIAEVNEEEVVDNEAEEYEVSEENTAENVVDESSEQENDDVTDEEEEDEQEDIETADDSNVEETTSEEEAVSNEEAEQNEESDPVAELLDDVTSEENDTTNEEAQEITEPIDKYNLKKELNSVLDAFSIVRDNDDSTEIDFDEIDNTDENVEESVMEEANEIGQSDDMNDEDVIDEADDVSEDSEEVEDSDDSSDSKTDELKDIEEEIKKYEEGNDSSSIEF